METNREGKMAWGDKEERADTLRKRRPRESQRQAGAGHGTLTVEWCSA